MLRTLVNLRTLVELAQLDLNLSVRSALRIVTAIATLILGFTFTLAAYMHNLRGPSFISIGDNQVDRVVLVLSVLWISAGAVTYGSAKRWVVEVDESASRSEEFSLRALLGADVLSYAFVERLALALFSAILLTILSVGALFYSSLEDLGVLVIGSGLGFSLYCQTGNKVLAYVAQPKRKIQYFSILRMIVPLSFATVIAIIIWGWQGMDIDVHISQTFVIVVSIVVTTISAVTLTRLTRAISTAYGRPLGVLVDIVSKPIDIFGKGIMSPRAHTLALLFIKRPFLTGLVATRWTIALTLIFFAVNVSSVSTVNIADLSQNMVWIVAFAFVTTLQTVNTVPDLLQDGPLLRFYYEERGSFPVIFATALLTRTLAIVPQTVVMIVLWSLVGGTGKQALVLAVLAIVSDLLARGVAGSSYRRASQYTIMVASLVSFTVTAIGTVFLQISPLVTACLVVSALIFAYMTWRKNVTHAN